jgi:hypothetical protein
MSARESRRDQDAIPGFEVLNALSCLGDYARTVRSGNVGKRNVPFACAAPHPDIKMIERGGLQGDQYFACTWSRVGCFFKTENLRPAELVNSYCLHFRPPGSRTDATGE